MATVQGVIQETGQGVNIDIPTARLPELPKFADVADDDIIAAYDTSDNKTKGLTIAMIRDKLVGQGVPTTPVLSNGIVQLVVDAVHSQNLRWDLPQLAGKQFTLERRGIGLLTTDEYQVLSTGGFLLIGVSPVMELGETFILTVQQLQGGEGSIIGGSGSAFITGMVVINDNTTYSDSHKNKLIAIAGGDSNHVTYTLPDVTLAPENLLIPIETNINNKYQSTITAQSGQLIYFNGRSYSSVFMGLGENLWLLAGTDGWYVISAYGNYQTVGEIIPSYKKDVLNTVILMGQLLNRADYPRLWQEVSGFGTSLVPDGSWKVGLWSTGDGSKTFRCPDLRAQFIRGLDYGAGKDQDRINAAGGSVATLAGSDEPSANKSHQHTNLEADNSAHGSGSSAHSNPTPILVNQDSNGNNGHAILPGSATGFSGGYESRPDNIALFYLIKC